MQNDGSVAFQHAITNVERLLASLMPKETALLANYPNPFNPETWIPYQLASPADVTLHIHGIDGTLVRTLSLGHKATGIYQSRNRAAYWDGRNEVGESVASGVYFYTLTAGRFQRHPKNAHTQIVSNDHRIAGMLMFISFAAILSDWVE